MSIIHHKRTLMNMKLAAPAVIATTALFFTACVSTRSRTVEKQVTETKVQAPVAQPVDRHDSALAFVNQELKEGIQFRTGSAEIPTDTRATLGKLAELLKQDPEQKLKLDGFADNTGTTQFNQSLSEKRAEAVRTFLIEQGVDSAQIQASAHGEDHPIADNSTSPGRAQNRRVEFVILQ
jgi:outer membrane protein OmpA-like peptidoglycan-associated protein